MENKKGGKFTIMMRRLKKRKPISIQWKIFLWLLSFCSVLLITLWLFQVVFLESFYKVIKTNEVRQDAQIIRESMYEANWQEVIDKVAEKNELYVELWTPEGQSVIVGSLIPGVQEKMSGEDKLALYNETISAGGELMERYIVQNSYEDMVALGEKQEEGILYSCLLEGEDGRSALLIVSTRISPVNSTVQTLRTQLIYITAGMILFASITALFMARIVSEPIFKLNRAAKELGKGNYDVKFEGGGYREITELADTLSQAEKDLSKVNNLQKELVANISHDLRTPLTLIAGYVEMMRDFPEEDNAENLELVLDECHRMTTLVKDTLDISKIQSGTVEIYKEKFSLTEAIEENINRLRGLIEKNGHEVTFDYEEPAFIYADPLRVSQVIYNLINNALTHTGEDQKVSIYQKELKGRVFIEIEDTGEGIPAESLPYIWDRYYKVDKVHRQSVTGTGLGLSIVKSILDMHKDATYGVESVLGKGTRFWFSFPLA